MLDATLEVKTKDHMPRRRITALLAEAAASPLVIVRAGAGCGKTRAVRDFTRGVSARTIWTQFTARDNACSRFWAKYTRIIADWNTVFAERAAEDGFPDTEDKINRHIAQRTRCAPAERRLIVLDDLHVIEDPDILRFLDRAFREPVRNTAVMVLCRGLPEPAFEGARIRGLVPVIGEEELAFTENEVAAYLAAQGVEVLKRSLCNICKDTAGWAFSVNLVARGLKKSPGYEGYVQVAMKRNLYRLMASEAFDTVSQSLRRFLVRLSLIDHLSGELVAELAGGDEALLEELWRQSAYIRYESDVNAWFIQHIFLAFLRTRQEMLTENEKDEAFRAAARWSAENGFAIDALGYYEKLGDYEALVAVLTHLPVQMPADIARFAAEIFDRAPEELAYNLEYFAVMRVRVLNRLGRWAEALALMGETEKRLLSLPEDDGFRNRTLGLIYYAWGNLRALGCTADFICDFDQYYAKMSACMAKTSVMTDQYADLPMGFWISLAGSPKKGALEEYCQAAKRTVKSVAACWGGATSGIDVLCEGELLFYRGDIKSAIPAITEALRLIRKNKLCEAEWTAMFTLMRMALWQGDAKSAEQTLRELETRLDEKNTYSRYIHYDMALAFYYCALRQPEMIPAWLKERFSEYSHAYFIENQGNQLKARYHYQTRKFPPLLAYIEGALRRESILYGRVELLAMAACVRYQTKERAQALRLLKEGYENAVPNGITAPFIELGRDMRTLASAALKEANGAYAQWLENIRRRAASFAKTQSLMIAGYERLHGSGFAARLTAREREILKEIYTGLSRAEIAAKQAVSVNTVNSAISGIFSKLGAKGTVDAVRIAAENRIV